jgi:hypothetical protein
MILSKRKASYRFCQRQCFLKGSISYLKHWLVVLVFAAITYACNGELVDVQTGRYELTGTRHEQTTYAGVSGWVNSYVASQMVKYSTIGDSDPKYRNLSQTHFDNCYWNEGRDWVILNRNNAIAYAIIYQANGKKKDLKAFFESFGFMIHATEDFYAPSNWVETHDPGVLADFNDPGAPMPNGWYSGTYNNSGDTGPNAGALHCPSGTPTHAQMNKDGVGSELDDEAFFDATLATTDQINRIIAGIRAAVPDIADSVLAAVGFVFPIPANTQVRSDYTSTVEVTGGPSGLTTPMLFCRPGTYAAAFEQQVEPHGSADNTALNSVMFYCKDYSGVLVEPLVAWWGVWGSWSTLSTCSSSGGFINSAELKVAPPGSGDDTSANAARFWCNDNTELVANNDGPLGEWSGAASCANGEVVCGVQIKYQTPRGDGDDTAMNGLNLLCCSLM